ncbi:FAD-dependent thymidylate synthase [Streptomyces griseus]
MTDFTLRSDVSVELVKNDASDHDVLFAARVSTSIEQSILDAARGDCEHQGPECQWSRCGLSDRDKGLINYLMRDRHGSPFEHNSMTFRISAPIFVFREFMRHRVGWSYNEESGRYKELDPVFYVPGQGRKLVQQGKPGKYEMVEGTFEQGKLAFDTMLRSYSDAYQAYQTMLSAGIAREVARSVLPVGMFSTMYATCNARSLMHFLGLRTQHELAKVPSFPQREIEMVGEQMEAHWAELMPVTHAAFGANGRVAP